MALKSNGVTQVPNGLGAAGQVLKVNSAGTAGEWGSIATTDNTKLPLAGGTMTGDISLGDNVNLYLGDSSDASLVFDGTDTKLTSQGELILNGQTGVTIDCNNVTNQPTLFLSDMGAGNTGILLKRATGGSIMYGQSMDHSRPLAIKGTNKSLGFVVAGSQGNGYYAAFDFSIDANASSRHPAVMGVRSPNNNALLFQGEQSDSTVVFSVDYDGNVATSGTVDGVDIAARDSVLTSTTTTANAALPKAGGTMTGDINFGNHDKAIFGINSNLQIWSDDTHSYIQESYPGGNLYIRAESFNVGRQANSELYITAFPNGAVNLYHDNAIKLATTSTGIDVTGDIGVSGTVDGVDIAARDAILTSTTTTAGAALPKAGGAMTGDLLIQKAEPIINLRRSDNDESPGLLWQGSGGAQAASIRLDGDSGITNSLVISTYNGSSVAEKLRILTAAANAIQVTGNVGIGTATPSTKLDISTSGADGITLNADANNATISSRLFFNNGTAGKAISIMNNGNNLSISTAATPGSGSGSEKVRILENGNVGIGTTNPTVASGTGLVINGGTNQARLALKNDATGDGSGDGFQIVVTSGSGSNGGQAIFEQRENNIIAFKTNGSEAMRILPSGNVGIGTATPATALEVNGAILAKVHHEFLTVGTIASNIVSLDLNTGSSVVIVATPPGANFSLAITNALNTGNTTTGLAIIVTQSPSPFIPNALTVNGSAVTINWLGGSAPAGTGSKTEIFSFTLINTGGVFIALGSVSTFG